MGTGISKIVFQPPEPTYSRDPNLIWLHTAQNEVIPAFFIDRDAKFTLLFSHGNAEDLGMIIQYFREVSHILEVNIFAYEYTGYGMSGPGEPSEQCFYADIEAAFKYLRDIIGVPWDEIILYGRSIGSGPSCHLATKTAVRGMVLQSPLLSIYRIPFHLRFTLPGDLFPNIDQIGKVKCPVYIVHGTKDEIVPVWHGQDLQRGCAAGSKYEPLWIVGGGHNNLEIMARELFFERFLSFLKYLENTPISETLQKQAEQPLI